MKRYISKKLFVTMAIVFCAAIVLAQFVRGPRSNQPFTIPAGGWIKSSATPNTNVASPAVFRLSGTAPLLFYVDWGATNGTTGVSNVVFNFQCSIDGTKWFGDGDNWISTVDDRFPQLVLPGPGAGDFVITNIADADDCSAYNYIRLHSISNFSGGEATNTFYITNAYFLQGSL